MRSRSVVTVLTFALSLSAVLMNISSRSSVAATACDPSVVCYFHGSAADQTNKITGTGTARFDQAPPTGTIPMTQATTGVANQNFAGNALTAYWYAPFSGSIPANTLLELDWYWSTANAETIALGLDLDITVFADPQLGKVQNDKIIGRAGVKATAAPTPTLSTSFVPITGTVAAHMLVQVAAHFSDTGEGVLVHYDSTSTPSRFRFVAAPQPPPVIFDTTTTIAFGPSAVVSAHFLGGEPQATIERRLFNPDGSQRSQAGRIDPDRIFVDWPLSSRTQTSQLSRSTDGGQSFRLVLDRACAARNRPNCLTAGGGDSEQDVNLINGDLYFFDQEAAVVNEGLASSTDHGDSFPATRQFAITNSATGVDRQWLAWVDPSLVTVGASRVEAFMHYHVPIAGVYIQGVDQNGVPIPQPVPQLTLVAQSGQLRVDNSGGPGNGWIYLPYRGLGGVTVATAYGPSYQVPTAWTSTVVSADNALIFPWVAIDGRGNAYLVWTASSGKLFLSVSPIDDPRNSPAAGGRPGTFWTSQAQINPPSVKVTVFPEVTAGDAGRIAVAYMGSEDCVVSGTPAPDSCAASSSWNTYAGVVTDALAPARGAALSVATGHVNHRVVHRGSVCTSGTTCSGDRSLLDMLDLSFDEDGRVGVVFMDNNNRLAAPNLTDNSKAGPFTHFAKVVQGPSLLASKPAISLSVPQGSVSDAAGDATWPNAAGAANLPSLDLRGASISINADGQLVARVPLADATRAGMARDLAAYNAVLTTQPAAERLQYVVRLATVDDVFHLSMEFNADGTTRFFGGRLDANDKVENGFGATVGARYATDAAYTVTGTLRGGALILRAPAAQFGLGVGSQLYSVSAFATAAPAETNPTATLMFNSARTVDATPPFDATLAVQAETPASIDCADQNVTMSGGWATLSDSRAMGGQYCRSVGSNKDGTKFLQFQFTGSAIDVFGGKGPRGGDLKVTLDGTSVLVDEYRAPTDPTHPDTSGRKDLDLGVNIFHAGSLATLVHTLRIDVVNDKVDPLRNMVYVDGFAITGGDIATPPTVGTTDVTTLAAGAVGPLGTQVLTLVVPAGAQHLALIFETAHGLTAALQDAAGSALGTAQGVGGVATLEVGPLSAGTSTALLTNADSVEEAFELWEVVTQSR